MESDGLGDAVTCRSSDGWGLQEMRWEKGELLANALAYVMVACHGYQGRRRCAHRCGGQGVMLHLLGVVTESVDPMERACGGLFSVMSTVRLERTRQNVGDACGRQV